MNSLFDTDKRFYTACADAGPDRYAFWAPSPDYIRRNLTNPYSFISIQPIPVKMGNTLGYYIDKMLHNFVSTSFKLYATFPLLGLAELAIAARNSTTIYKMMTSSPFECSGDSSSKGLGESPSEAQRSGRNDGVDIRSRLKAIDVECF